MLLPDRKFYFRKILAVKMEPGSEYTRLMDVRSTDTLFSRKRSTCSHTSDKIMTGIPPEAHFRGRKEGEKNPKGGQDYERRDQ